MEESRGFVCELCAEKVLDGEPHIRISADVAVRGKGHYGALNDNRILVFATFHSDCVMATMHNSDCDEAPYIWEARAVLENGVLCDGCRDRVSPPVQKRPHGLTVLSGGLSQ